ncbi:hypothetical protein M0Q97_04960 [Candidatus Dojkabacteria bacterium]|jgi:hypothetical protein|nr:hypothetical protein [Candidatus Dojkabacteria bacterium]
MKVYFFEELYEKSVNDLLELLSNYVYLRNDMCDIMKYDPDNKDLYIESYLHLYLLNITKIKEVLKNKTILLP